MPKLASLPTKAPEGAVKTVGSTPDTRTYEGGAGFTRDPKGELFMLAVTNMVGEKTFYESGRDRDERFEALIRQVALEDPDWIARFVPFLRNEMNMRSASIVMAAELVHQKLTQPVPASTVRNRDVIASAIVRADEPAEMLGYWMSRFGKHLPQPVKRGVADAVLRLYSERNVVKWDGEGKPIRFADVIELVHPDPKAPWQSALFKYLLDKRHGRGTADGEILTRLAEYEKALALSGDAFREAFTADFVRDAELTWETASSRYGKLDARFWEAMIPNMGIFAIVRNLRNFDQAGINDESIAAVKAKLVDPEVISKSRMFPIRFLGAWAATNSMRWGEPLETALNLSLANVPQLKGNTLVLVDISGSMTQARLSDKSELTREAGAAVFGAALALRAEKADLVAFETDSRQVHFSRGEAILRLVEQIKRKPHEQGGTNTLQAVDRWFKGHDRIIIVTDEQATQWGQSYSRGFWGSQPYPSWEGKDRIESIKAPIYLFNLAGYKAGMLPVGEKGRYAFGGLSDTGFKAIELLEAGKDQNWPF